jgi:hypothetical protein
MARLQARPGLFCLYFYSNGFNQMFGQLRLRVSDCLRVVCLSARTMVA